jgi:hypothetical protein
MAILVATDRGNPAIRVNPDDDRDMGSTVKFRPVAEDNRISYSRIAGAQPAVRSETGGCRIQRIGIKRARFMPHKFDEVGAPIFWLAVIAVRAATVAPATVLVGKGRATWRPGFPPGDCGNSSPE